ncbi:hypothetical protein PHET_06175 [Paragonimus heterotremus]|uniref:FYVE-type domain-containing protein n=1 Tax=Paragonimus heterotremus TaxID=100268 RepID=A0A8J4T7F2_9TREM|nr:hypothetical protein PHET_06175 [Paragonimus heterotremus]
MSSDNVGLVSKLNIESPPTVVHKGRISSSDVPIYKTSNEFSDPPGVPVSPLTGSVRQLPSDTGTDMSTEFGAVQLVDEKEQLMFEDCEAFVEQLGCPMDQPVKVVAVVGNTGDGKSYTMNHTFFHGTQVFATSPSQTTCTMGVWAAYVPSKSCILLDTEGMLGTTLNQNQHRRLLLKVFAVADVVIYLTKAPRLHTDMFTFLADASDSFAQHFRPDLEALAKRTGLPWSAGQLGPAVIVFQETRHTDPLDGPYKTTSNAPSTHSVFLESTGGSSKPASNPVSGVLQNRLADMKRNVNSFSAMHYIGIQTKDGPTDFKPLSLLTSKLLKDNSVRAPRKVEHVFCSLHLLNTRFATDIPATGQYTFVEEYFTCPVTCDSCSARCCLSVGHTTGRHQARLPASSDQPSDTPTGCRYDPSLENKVYYCKDCYALGIKNIVVPKAGDSVFDAARFLYSGYVLECKRHGIIYKSRSLWSSNAEPEDTARVHWEVVHVWSGEKTLLQGVHPFSQILMDGLNTVTKQVSELAGPPVRLLGDLFADSLAPEYWQPNATIRMCAICKFEFPSPSVDGVDYDSLAKRKVTVESAGEHRTNADETALVLGPGKSGKPMRGTPLLPRTSTLTPLSLEEGKDTTGLTPMSKPTAIPKKELIDTDKHHCRACGRGVCGACSTGSLPVPGFGPGPVRVCDDCYTKRRGRRVSSPHSDSKARMTETQLTSNPNNVYTGRKALEMYSVTVNSVPPVFSMFKDTLKGFVRPDYWTPDHLCKMCALCDRPFGPSRHIHHCRACGRGVCQPCSPHRQPVPLRGLDLPHRVCNDCFRPNA